MTASALVMLALAGVASPTPPPPTPVVVVRDERITESSGLVVSPTHAGLAWTVNDSGSAAVVYGVSTRTGRTRAVLTLADTDARDVEAVTAGRRRDGRGVLVTADTGDNRRVRTSVVLRVLVEPRSVRSRSVRPVSLRVRYPGGPADVETVLWTRDGRLLLVTKDLLSATVLQVPRIAVDDALAGRPTTEPVLAREVATVQQSLVTDGAALPDGRLVLRGYDSAIVYAAPSDGQLREAGRLALPAQGQGETLAVERGGRTVLVGSEGLRQRLWRVSLPPAAAPSVAPTPSPSTASPSTPSRSTPSPSTPASRPTSAQPPATPTEPARTGTWVGVAVGSLVGLAVLTGVRRRARRRP